MEITCDPKKREWTLKERGLDFMEAAAIFAGPTLSLVDDRKDYGEVRMQTYGVLAGRIVMVVWTPRGDVRHIISMRHCHDDESFKVADRLR